jgi:hypothetical protein
LGTSQCRLHSRTLSLDSKALAQSIEGEGRNDKVLSKGKHLFHKFMGTYKVRNEIETKQNETKQNQRKRNETKRNQQKRNETKRNQRNENEIKRNQRKQNEINENKTK